MYYTQNSYVCFECNSVLGKGGPQRRDSYRKASALTPGAQTCALPRPTFLRQHMLPSSFKREDDGREGAISGRLARKATGVSPSSFARIGVFAGKWYLQISPETIVQKHDAGRFPRRRGGSVEVWRCFPGRASPCTTYYKDRARDGGRRARAAAGVPSNQRISQFS